MKIIRTIKRRIGFSVLYKNIRNLKREKRLVCFEEAKSVGIVFDATFQQSYDIVYNFVSYLKTLNLEISALGYVNGKKLPNSYILRRNFNFFLKKDLNWFGKPVVPVVTNFINSRFDILINLDCKNLYPLQYIAGLSKSTLKVGKHKNTDNFCDLTIELKENNNISYLIEQIKFYLPQLTKQDLVAVD